MGLLHPLQAAAVLVLANRFSLPVTASHLAGPPGSPLQEPTVLFDSPIAWGVCGFLATSAVAHWVVASPFCFPRYAAGPQRGRNTARWVEYSVSSSITIVLVAQIVGISDGGALPASFAVNQLLQYTRAGKWRDHLYGEKVSVVLGLVAKSLLAWQVFANTSPPRASVTRVDMRVAAYAVIVERGADGPGSDQVAGPRMLLAHWNESGHSGWTLPGGGLEPGEDPADAAVREVGEETGCTAALDELLGVDSVVFPAEGRIAQGRGPLHALRIVYRAHVTGGELRDEVGGTTDTARWFPLDAVDGLGTVSIVDVARRMAGLLA